MSSSDMRYIATNAREYKNERRYKSLMAKIESVAKQGYYSLDVPADKISELRFRLLDDGYFISEIVVGRSGKFYCKISW